MIDLHASMDERAAFYLRTYAAGGAFAGGLSFQTALAQSRLDHTLQGLDRIDHLLDRIRLRFQPQPHAFLRSTANQNFVYLLCFHVGTVAAAQTGRALRWVDHAELGRLLAPAAAPPYGIATSVASVFDNGAYLLPLAPVLGRLFGAGPSASVRLSVERCLEPDPPPA